MKDKLAPHIKRVKNNIFEISSAYLSVDFKPLITFLSTIMKKDLNRLLDNPVRILVIQNYSFGDLEARLKNIPFKEINIIRTKEEKLNDVLHLFKEDYYDFIIVTHFDNDDFKNEDLNKILKRFTCPIFVSNNSELINLLTS